MKDRSYKMKKFIMFTFVVIGLVFSCFAEVKKLTFQTDDSETTIFYSNSSEDYWTKDDVIEYSGNKPYIYWEELDYTLDNVFEGDFSKWSEKTTEIVVPILKKYKYVYFLGDYFDVEYFLIEENKYYGRIWWAALKNKDNKKKTK